MNQSTAVVRLNVWHPADALSRVDRVAKKAWKYGWGLLFVLAMTALAEWGPRLGYSKEPPAPAPVVRQVAAQAIK
jgi:hypothetical protein